MKRYKIAVDAGHGGFGVTPGKRSPDGEFEWSFNNKVVLALIERLSQYGCFDVCRTDDPTGKTDVPLATRVKRANDFCANLFVSAHQNANRSEWGSHGGTETFYYGADPKGKRLATLVQKRLIDALGLRDRGVKDGSKLYVINNTNMTAILTEGAFMDSTTDIAVLRDDAKLKAQGYAIADGIAEYLSVELPQQTGAGNAKGGEEELTFSSPTLKEIYATRSVSPGTTKLLAEKVVNVLNYDKSWIEKAEKGEITEGDKAAMAYELAVYYAKQSNK